MDPDCSQLWQPRPGAISFPEGQNWWGGYFKVMSVSEHVDARNSPHPMPAEALPLIFDKVASAYAQVLKVEMDTVFFVEALTRGCPIPAMNPTGFAGRLQNHCAQFGDGFVVESANGTFNLEGREAPHMFIYVNESGRLEALCGHFGDEVDSEFSMIDQLSTDAVGLYDTATKTWSSNGDVCIYASPCLGVPEDPRPLR